MFTHVVVMTFKADAPADQADRIVAALSGLPSAIPELKDYRIGKDLGLVEGNWDLGVVALFDNEADYRTYSTAPAHVKIVSELVRPFVDQRAALQFES
ncbi:MAG: Dabb family protein [Acidimicrobiaceae bacterium]|nr:Dabb family protein [Acidimicrobiaceae bacterium]